MCQKGHAPPMTEEQAQALAKQKAEELRKKLEREGREGRKCPAREGQLVNLFACHLCQFGHMTGCHYPDSSHSLEKCNHSYGEEDEDEESL